LAQAKRSRNASVADSIWSNITIEAPLECVWDGKTCGRKTRLLPLEELRNEKALEKMATLRPGNRLSITPVTEAEWKRIQNLL
jgi:predicted RNA-binding protein with PUA-like domain